MAVEPGTPWPRFDDEEPDRMWTDHDTWLELIAGLCPLCGWEGHTGERCPNVQPWMLRHD